MRKLRSTMMNRYYIKNRETSKKVRETNSILNNIMIMTKAIETTTREVVTDTMEVMTITIRRKDSMEITTMIEETETSNRIDKARDMIIDSSTSRKKCLL
jgi:hypothetical protein